MLESSRRKTSLPVIGCIVTSERVDIAASLGCNADKGTVGGGRSPTRAHNISLHVISLSTGRPSEKHVEKRMIHGIGSILNLSEEKNVAP